MPDSNLNPELESQKRRTTRIVQAVPLTVTGVDALGRPFQERTSTLIINCHGCRYQSKHYVLKNMWVTFEVPHNETDHEPRSVRARVSWIQRPRTVRELFQIGVELEVAGNVWGIAFPPGDWFPFPESTSGAEIPLPSENVNMDDSESEWATPETPTPQEPEPAENNVRVISSPVGTDPSAQVTRQVARLVAEAKQQVQITARETATRSVAAETRSLLTALQDQLKGAAEQSVQAAVTANLERTLREAQQRMQGERDASVVAMRAEWSRELDRRITEAREQINSQLEEVERARRADFEEQIQGQLLLAIEKVQNLSGSLDANAGEVRTAIDHLRKSSADAASGEMERWQGLMNQRSADAQARLAHLEQTAKRLGDQIDATTSIAEAGWRGLLETDVARATAQWNEKMEVSLEEAALRIAERLEKKNEEAAQEMEQRLHQRIGVIGSAFSQVTAEAEGALGTQRASISSESAKVEATISQLQKSFEQMEQRRGEFSSLLDTVSQELSRRGETLLETQNNELNRRADSTVAGVAQHLQTVLDSASQELSRRGEALLEAQSNEMNRRADSAVAGIVQHLQPVLDSASQELSRRGEALLEAQSNELNRRTESAVTGITQHLQPVLDSASQELSRRGEALLEAQSNELNRRAESAVTGMALHLHPVLDAASQELSRRGDALLEAQSNEMSRRAESAVAGMAQRLQPVLEAAGQQTISQLAGELDRRLAPQFARASEILSKLATDRELAEKALSEHQNRVWQVSERSLQEAVARSKDLLAQVEKEFAESTRSNSAKWLTDLETKATETTHSTFESLFKSADWYEKKVQTQMQTTLEKGLDQATANLREKAGELSGLFASELDHYSRSYVEHAQSQIQENARDVSERTKLQLADASGATIASFSERTAQVGREQLDQFQSKANASSEQSAARMEAHNTQVRSKLEIDARAFAAEFQRVLLQHKEQSLMQGKQEITTQLDLAKTALHVEAQSLDGQFRGSLQSIGTRAMEEHKQRLDNASNSWLLTTVTKLNQQSEELIEQLAASTEKRLKSVCGNVFAEMGETLRQRFAGLSAPLADFSSAQPSPFKNDPSDDKLEEQK